MDTNETPPEGPAGMRKPRLTAMERLAMETGLDAGRTPYAIAQGIGRPPKTVMREIGGRAVESGRARQQPLRPPLRMHDARRLQGVPPAQEHAVQVLPPVQLALPRLHRGRVRAAGAVTVRPQRMRGREPPHAPQAPPPRRPRDGGLPRDPRRVAQGRQRHGGGAAQVRRTALPPDEERAVRPRGGGQQPGAVHRQREDALPPHRRRAPPDEERGPPAQALSQAPQGQGRGARGRPQVPDRPHMGRLPEVHRRASRASAHGDGHRGGDGGGKVPLTPTFMPYCFMLALLMDGKTAADVSAAFAMIRDRLVGRFGRDAGLAMTTGLFPVPVTDNGTGFTLPDEIGKGRGGSKVANPFHANPGASYQKPHAERNHGFVRLVPPKGSHHFLPASFDALTQNDADLMMSHINGYVRGASGDKTPYGLMTGRFGVEFADLFSIGRMPANDVVLRPSLLGIEQRVRPEIIRATDPKNSTR